jgi:glucosamine-6-phosphate deaminase
MNEPGSTADGPTTVVSLHEATMAQAVGYGEMEQAPTWGITVGMRPLLAAREIWLIVSGAAKAEILESTLNGDIGPHVPASYLRRHTSATVFADDAAAALL